MAATIDAATSRGAGILEFELEGPFVYVIYIVGYVA
jgi:hypothetical protein